MANEIHIDPDVLHHLEKLSLEATSQKPSDANIGPKKNNEVLTIKKERDEAGYETDFQKIPNILPKAIKPNNEPRLEQISSNKNTFEGDQAIKKCKDTPNSKIDKLSNLCVKFSSMKIKDTFKALRETELNEAKERENTSEVSSKVINDFDKVSAKFSSLALVMKDENRLKNQEIHTLKQERPQEALNELQQHANDALNIREKNEIPDLKHYYYEKKSQKKSSLLKVDTDEVKNDTEGEKYDSSKIMVCGLPKGMSLIERGHEKNEKYRSNTRMKEYDIQRRTMRKPDSLNQYLDHSQINENTYPSTLFQSIAWQNNIQLPMYSSQSYQNLPNLNPTSHECPNILSQKSSLPLDETKILNDEMRLTVPFQTLSSNSLQNRPCEYLSTNNLELFYDLHQDTTYNQIQIPKNLLPLSSKSTLTHSQELSLDIFDNENPTVESEILSKPYSSISPFTDHSPELSLDIFDNENPTVESEKLSKPYSSTSPFPDQSSLEEFAYSPPDHEVPGGHLGTPVRPKIQSIAEKGLGTTFLSGNDSEGVHSSITYSQEFSLNLFNNVSLDEVSECTSERYFPSSDQSPLLHGMNERSSIESPVLPEILPVMNGNDIDEFFNHFSKTSLKPTFTKNALEQNKSNYSNETPTRIFHQSESSSPQIELCNSGSSSSPFSNTQFLLPSNGSKTSNSFRNLKEHLNISTGTCAGNSILSINPIISHRRNKFPLSIQSYNAKQTTSNTSEDIHERISNLQSASNHLEIFSKLCSDTILISPKDGNKQINCVLKTSNKNELENIPVFQEKYPSENQIFEREIQEENLGTATKRIIHRMKKNRSTNYEGTNLHDALKKRNIVRFYIILEKHKKYHHDISEVNARDSDGKTVYDIAMELREEKIEHMDLVVKYLEGNGAVRGIAKQKRGRKKPTSKTQNLVSDYHII